MARETIDIIIQERGGRQVARAIDGIGDSADRSQGLVQLLRQSLRTLGMGLVIREILQTVDSYQRLQNQLRVVGYEQAQLAKITEDLFDISQRTRTPLEETANLYGKLAQSASELGKSEADMLKFTEATGQALAIQGTSLQGSRAALLQLSQAMGEGIVRAQEYNSLVENARPLLMAAANGIEEAGGSVAKLRSIMLDGELTSERFFQGVLDGSKVLEDQFGNTVPTISQALTVLNNAWTRFLGESKAGQMILAGVSQSLMWLANNFEAVVTIALGGAVALGAWIGGGILSQLAANAIRAAGAQLMLAGGFTAVNVASLVTAGAIRLVTGAVYGLTAAIASNPIGALAVALVAVLTYLYQVRDAMVTVGTQTASVGAIVAEVWDRAKKFVLNFAEQAWSWIKTMAENIGQRFMGLSDEARTMANFLIAVVKSFVDIWLAQFKLMYDAGVAVFKGIAAVGGGIMSGLGSAIKGDFAAAGEAFSSAFSAENFNFDQLVATANETATTVGSNFGRDFVGEFGGAIDSAKDYVAGKFEGLVEAAAKRDIKVPVEEFEFAKVEGGGYGSGKDGDKKKKTKKELTDLEKAYKEVVQDTRGELEKMVNTQKAIDMALKEGIITQDQATVKQQEIRMSLAKWAIEGHNAADAIRETNVAILEMRASTSAGTFGDGFLAGLARMSQAAVTFASSAGQTFTDFFSTVQDGFANSVGRAIVYSENLGEAMRKVADEALASLISGLVKLGMQWLLNAAIGNSVAAAATAATAAQASAATAAWAPAAALAALATGGANAAPANAAIAATLAATKALASGASAFADGGHVTGPGGPRDDAILAKLSNGEFVVNARATKENRGLLEAINSGLNVKKMLPQYKDGGPVAKKGNKLRQQAGRDVDTAERQQAQGQATPGNTNVEVPVKVVNVQDPNAAIEALQTSKGERMIMNILESNPEAIKAILRS